MKIKILPVAILLSAFTFGCSSNVNNVIVSELSQINTVKKEAPITVLVKLDVPPFISTPAGELSGIAVMDDGKIVKYQTVKTARGVTATTTTYASKWVKIESHPTTENEAQTILKLAGQGGFSKEYKTLKDRYTEAGIID
jgi:hypothetical protein